MRFLIIFILCFLLGCEQEVQRISYGKIIKVELIPSGAFHSNKAVVTAEKGVVIFGNGGKNAPAAIQLDSELIVTKLSSGTHWASWVGATTWYQID